MPGPRKPKYRSLDHPHERLNSLVAVQMAGFVRREFEANGIKVHFNSTYAGRRKNLLGLKIIAQERAAKLTAGDPYSLQFATALAIRLPALWDDLQAQKGSIQADLAAELADFASLTTDASTLRATLKRMASALKASEDAAQAQLTEAAIKHKKRSSEGGSARRWYVAHFETVFSNVALHLFQNDEVARPEHIRNAVREIFARANTARTPPNGVGEWKRLSREFVFKVIAERSRIAGGKPPRREVVNRSDFSGDFRV